MFNNKRHTGHRQRTIDRIHMLVRLELGNPLLTSLQIAQLFGITHSSLARLKSLPLYHQVHNQYFSGVIHSLDKQVDSNLSISQKTLEFAVPLAMQKLLKQAMQEKDLRVQNKACNDILDRDGHFAKVKRIGLATPEQGGVAAGVDKDNDVASALIQAIQNNKQSSQQAPVAPDITTPPITNTTQ